MNQKHIRNFAIIAHVDHGKSTLADRFLEITKTISKDKLQEQFLDQNPISRERGITIKLAPVRMHYIHDGDNYMLNLIDTPGHVDFSYEVSRTLAACDGAVLLVDATQGIQAQTVAHFRAAVKEGLTLIPVINKIDLPNAQVEVVEKELEDIFELKKEDMLHISAKTGENVRQLLDAIVTKLPAPKGKETDPLRALIFDAAYDEYRGVIAYVRVFDGSLTSRSKVSLYQSGAETEATEVGFFSPYLISAPEISTGEIGYIVLGVKDIRKSRVGDTITNSEVKTQNSNFIPLPGYELPKPMVFFGIYPKDQNDFVHLRESLAKLTLNDTALTYSSEYSSYLGSGFRVGFLGLLHAEIVKERLSQEFGLELLLTRPQVLYDKREDDVLYEPYMRLSVFTPTEYVGGVMSVCQKKKGSMINLQYHQRHAELTYDMPYSMFIRGLAGDIKSVSAGFASLDYELTEYRIADIVKLEILINTVPIDVLSELVYKDEAMFVAREKAEKLKDSLTRQQFRQIIQATIDGTIASREEIPPFRKDVLQKMSGGDRSRKDKLLDAQKKGKSKLKSVGKVALPQEALYSLVGNE